MYAEGERGGSESSDRVVGNFGKGLLWNGLGKRWNLNYPFDLEMRLVTTCKGFRGGESWRKKMLGKGVRRLG